jgi:hypothetical protein
MICVTFVPIFSSVLLCWIWGYSLWGIKVKKIIAYFDDPTQVLSFPLILPIRTMQGFPPSGSNGSAAGGQREPLEPL